VAVSLLFESNELTGQCQERSAFSDSGWVVDINRVQFGNAVG